MQQNSSGINLVRTVLPCLEILNMRGPKIMVKLHKGRHHKLVGVGMCKLGVGTYVQAGCGYYVQAGCGYYVQAGCGYVCASWV